MRLRPLYIFDFDGTLANIEHRLHYITDKKHAKWDDFYRACVDDQPNKPIMYLYNQLSNDADIKIFSGRSDLVYRETIQWLNKYIIGGSYEHIISILTMRQHGDNTEDATLKKQWYEALSQDDKNRLVCIFDDRQKVVEMWRSLGLTCLQVASGNP